MRDNKKSGNRNSRSFKDFTPQEMTNYMTHESCRDNFIPGFGYDTTWGNSDKGDKAYK